ncbi:MAG: N-acetylmuramic acid 6-phosphate etherase [Chloroflexi bacterium]|nr:N-acetylmuramic acid 6-phosphate etherase [Chloroflexota bacterium]
MGRTLATEQRNPRTVDIDVSETIDILTMLNDEDARVPTAVRAILPALARVVDDAVERYRAGGTIYYFGAGASGRIGALDAAELPPTFSIPRERVVARIAGGPDSMIRAQEDLEDSPRRGEGDAGDVRAGDVVFGLTASGSTPYVAGVIRSSHAAGALTIVVSSNDNPALRRICDHYLHVDTGPESIAGSTRMKAATAQKLILNSFSTALMIRMGMTYSNLMVDVAQTNEKLRARAVRILGQATGRPEAVCRRHLERSGGRVKVALLTLLGAPSEAAAVAALDRAEGRTREALRYLDGARPPDET